MSDPMPDAVGQATARLDQLAAEARTKAERYRTLQAQAGQVSVTESSRDGMVTVTVDSVGNVADLRLTDRIKDLSGSQVSSVVLTTLRRAQARLPERLAEVMSATIGEDQQTIDTITANYRAKFPEPEPDEVELAEEAVPDKEHRIGTLDDDEPPAADEPLRRRPVRADDEDDEGDGDSFMVRK